MYVCTVALTYHTSIVLNDIRNSKYLGLMKCFRKSIFSYLHGKGKYKIKYELSPEMQYLQHSTYERVYI